MFEQLLTEAFNNSSYMDVRELRSLYYGRLNMYVSFTDNSVLVTEEKGRPDGIICHSIDTVVGRKASTSLLYGYVFRINKSGGRFIEDIKAYSKDDYKKDVELLKEVKWLDPEFVAAAAEIISNNLRIRKQFERLWELTRLMSSGDGKKWAQMLIDIGYIGFSDQSGLRILMKKSSPVTILLDTDSREDFDIVPVQKYRKDERLRIKQDVDKKTKELSVARNRVAKSATPKNRGLSKRKSFYDEMKEFVKTIGGM